MAKYEEMVKECNYFLDEKGYRDLPEAAKLQVNTYMRGLRDGMKIAQESGEKKEPVAV